MDEECYLSFQVYFIPCPVKIANKKFKACIHLFLTDIQPHSFICVHLFTFIYTHMHLEMHKIEHARIKFPDKFVYTNMDRFDANELINVHM